VVHYRNYEIACRASSNSLTAVIRDSLDLFDKRGINVDQTGKVIAYKCDINLRSLIKEN